MEEKKSKAARPTVRQMRALQAEIEGHLEDKHHLVTELNGWRKDFLQLEDKYKSLMGIHSKEHIELDFLRKEVVRLREALDARNQSLDSLLRDKHDLEQKLEGIKSRGFFARLFNR